MKKQNSGVPGVCNDFCIRRIVRFTDDGKVVCVLDHNFHTVISFLQAYIGMRVIPAFALLCPSIFHIIAQIVISGSNNDPHAGGNGIQQSLHRIHINAGACGLCCRRYFGCCGGFCSRRRLRNCRCLRGETGSVRTAVVSPLETSDAVSSASFKEPEGSFLSQPAHNAANSTHKRNM